MSIDRVIQLLASITLVEMMVTIGLSVTLRDVLSVAKNGRLVVGAVLSNYVIVPTAAVGLLLLLGASPMVAAGILVPAVCPGAPYGPPLTGLARGSVAASVGLMVILAASSALLAPLLLRFLLPAMGGGEALRVDAVKLVVTLVLTQFLPLCIGLGLVRWHPRLAARLKTPLGRLCTLLNLALLTVILAAQYRMLAEIRLVGYAGMLTLVAISVFAGWLCGGPGYEQRKSLAISTSIRNVGISLVIVSGSFAGTAAVTAATAFGLFQTIVMVLVALGWGRWTAGVSVGKQAAGIATA